MDPKHKKTPPSAEEHAHKILSPQDVIAQQMARRQHEAEAYHMEHTERVLAWLRKNAVPMASFLVALLVGISIYAWRTNSKSEAEALARDTLMSANSPQELLDLAANQPTSKVAPLAMLRAAQVFFEQDDYAKAREGFEAMLAQFPTHELASAAEYGLAKCLDAENKMDQALAAYADFVKKHPDNPLAPDAGFARILVLDRADKTAEAKTAAEDFIASSPADPWKEEAKTLLERIQSKLDRLTNPVVQPPPRPAPAVGEGEAVPPTGEKVEIGTPPPEAVIVPVEPEGAVPPAVENAEPAKETPPDPPAPAPDANPTFATGPIFDQFLPRFRPLNPHFDQ